MIFIANKYIKEIISFNSKIYFILYWTKYKASSFNFESAFNDLVKFDKHLSLI